VIDQKAETLQQLLQPDTVAGDNKYTKAMRIRRWAQAAVALITPAHRWQQGRYAQAYHRFLRRPDIAKRLQRRRTSVEPLFDLVTLHATSAYRFNTLLMCGLVWSWRFFPFRLR
jgi:hypothetical protein